jgi:cytochrome o ubiquinol oxidase operon protein cyoD
MSEHTHDSSHHSVPQHQGGHGSTKSYIFGFILSLIFTAIPYYLVVHKTVTGNALLGTIIGFAMLQMSVQIFFFLHLGRGPKPMYNVSFFVATIGLIAVVVVGSVFIMNNLHYNMSPTDVVQKLAQDEAIAAVGGQKTGACQPVLDNHTITISNGTVTPSHIDAKLCDTLTFLNQDDTGHTIAFGPNEKPEVYGGESEVSLYKGRGETITLNQSGTILFHDASNPALSGGFTVEQ